VAGVLFAHLLWSSEVINMVYAGFGIIKNFDKNKIYANEYISQKYNCVSIDDDVIEFWWERLRIMKSYFHCYNRPGLGLATWRNTYTS